MGAFRGRLFLNGINFELTNEELQKAWFNSKTFEVKFFATFHQSKRVLWQEDPDSPIICFKS